MRLVILAIVLCVPMRALADPASEAKQHRERAAIAYKEKRYNDVVAELQQAFALEPDPQLHFSLGQVYAKLGRCSDAIASYDRFMATQPSDDRAQTTREAIASCKPTAHRPIRPSEPAPPAIQNDPASPLPVREEAWHEDRLTVGLVGGGAALTVIGLIIYASARAQLDDAERAPDYGTQAALYDGANGKRILSVVFVLGGLAAAGIGGYHHYTRERGVTIAPTISFAPRGGGGGMLTWTTGF